ncbi:chromate efflux transporter [Chromatiaceae bacterium AAb-1]|nr:chromate efflux transporter [Chromatiaceae bacterium AAb-1]
MLSLKRNWDIFLVFLKLGLTSFGGPVAHIGYFREEFVSKRKWLTERDYSDLVALCQFLPGPASSQVGMAIGLFRGHYAGAVAAWLGFTLPSALLLILFAQSLHSWQGTVTSGMLHGLKIVAVAVVAQAVWGMAKSLCTDKIRISIMAAAACILLLYTSVFTQVAVIAFGAVAGWLLLPPLKHPIPKEPPLTLHLSRTAAVCWGLLFITLLVTLPLIAQSSAMLGMIDAFYRAGSLVFGGGHVVLPLLQAEVVPNGAVSQDIFMAGYGAAQAVPGPLFTFAAFLGASMNSEPTGINGGIIALLAIFAPSFMILAAVLPFWQSIRLSPLAQSAMAGVGASVVGVLLAALYQPVWTDTIGNTQDFALALLAFVALMYWKLPPWLIVLAGALTGSLMGTL